MPGQLIVLPLIVWTGLIAAFSYLTLPEKHLWIPVFLALTGVFSSVLPLAINPNLALVANAATLILFVVSLERLTPRRRRALHSVAIALNEGSAIKGIRRSRMAGLVSSLSMRRSTPRAETARAQE